MKQIGHPKGHAHLEIIPLLGGTFELRFCRPKQIDIILGAGLGSDQVAQRADEVSEDHGGLKIVDRSELVASIGWGHS